MDVGSSSYPHTSMGWPEGEMGMPVVSETCPPRAPSAPHIIPASPRRHSTKAGEAPANPTWLWLKGSGFLDKGM